MHMGCENSLNFFFVNYLVFIIVKILKILSCWTYLQLVIS